MLLNQQFVYVRNVNDGVKMGQDSKFFYIFFPSNKEKHINFPAIASA